jgi:outer membrane protein OmpA-like peptidoglycan-associated protein
MKHLTLFCVSAILFSALPAAGQDAAATKKQEQPIYNVTVVERSVKAINYEYRNGPTKIDFRGTVLLPDGKGEATVESKRGRTEIDARLEKLTQPVRYGREYLTYTLWAITPEGAAHNLGEIVPNGSDKADLHVTTDLQAFGLIVTAEPYSTARQPSDVVVLENEVRPDTVGKIQPIEVKYGLMPRGHYTLELGDNLQNAVANTPRVSMSTYEAMLEVYEAQNAVGIARAAGADKYAASTFEKAQALLTEAQRLQASKSATSLIVQDAREASQTAEDARVIAERRQTDEKLAAAQQEAAQARQGQAEAEAALRQAKIQADAARAQAEAERAIVQKTAADAAEARQQAEQAAASAAAARASAQPPAPPAQQYSQRSELRTQLMEQLKGVLPTIDTPRGLVVTVGDSSFDGSDLREAAARQVVQLAAIVTAHPGLRVDVEGFVDNTASEATSYRRAEAVGRVLLSQGVPDDAVSARGLGDSRLLVANSSPANREQNRRVEIVISGNSIGSLASWDRTYGITPEAMRSDKRN